ncbi:MAG: hypothetical protein ACYS22_15475 [Planctomycetota bacterium]|jgi:hypothetical protein
MANVFLRLLVRAKFATTSRKKAAELTRTMLGKYLRLAEGLDEASGRRPVRVPAMQGVDEDMRDWSFYMLLEHNAIVQRGITRVIAHLYRGEHPAEHETFDPKNDVMPSADPGPEQVEAFRSSVEDHLEAVSKLGKLRGTRALDHPLFGSFDAHKWNCMLGLHLVVHYRQAKHIASHARGDATPAGG